ncbi:hypothetical protein FRC03_007007 [Tulasnella sp. 419]|nr:hypothetical protein FRC03_007007 [Tulasnella sp. 419]
MDHSAVIQHAAQDASAALINLTTSRYMSVAGYCVLLYDHVTTFSDEVELIWMKPINTVSILFLLNRYGAPLVLAVDVYDKGGMAKILSGQFCASWFWIESYMQIMFHAMIHAIVALRVRAIWGLKPFINWILGISFVFYLSVTVTLTALGNAPLTARFYFNELFHLCYVDKLTEWFYWVWVPSLLFEAVLFTLTIVKAIQYRRRNTLLPVTRILYRDGIIYFVVIALCTCFNIIAWSALPSTLVTLAKYFGFAIISTMGSKLVLNLRGIRREDDVMVDPSLPSLPKFELSRLEPSNTRHIERPNSSAFDIDTNGRRLVRLNSYRERNQGQGSSRTPREPQNSVDWDSSVNGVQVHVDVHVDTDADGDSSWDGKGEEFGGKAHVHW